MRTAALRRFTVGALVAVAAVVALGIGVRAQSPPGQQQAAAASSSTPVPLTLTKPVPTGPQSLWQQIEESPRVLVWGLIVAALIVAVVGVLLYKTVGVTPPLILQLSPSFFFWLGMGYTALLLLVAMVFNIYRPSGPILMGGILPIAVPWFGALGAVTISLEGVFLENNHWDSKFNYWHIGRPLFGAVLGIVAFFIFIVTVSASGSAPKFLDDPTAPLLRKDYIIFYVLAFLVGYREETFRELIKRATDLILKPGLTAAPAPAPAVSVKIGGAAVAAIDFGKVTAGAPAKKLSDVVNSGTGSLSSPAVTLHEDAGTPVGSFTIVDQVSGKGDLGAGQSRSVEITFTPGAAGVFGATLTIAASNLPTPRVVHVSGQA